MIYIQSQQSTFPKAIYIGDKAELRCSFSSGAALSTGSLSAENFSQSLDFSLYDINEITLQKTGTDYYTLVINFIPWRTGIVAFPDYEIPGAGTIHLEGVQIQSLVEQQGATDIKTFTFTRKAACPRAISKRPNWVTKCARPVTRTCWKTLFCAVPSPVL